MKRTTTAKFYVIVSNVQTGSNIILNETFQTLNKCQAFVDKMNIKNTNSPIVFIATKDLKGIKYSKLKQIVNQA